MAIYIGYDTAWEFWSFADAAGVSARPAARIGSLENAEAKAIELAAASRHVWELGLLSRPFHVLVPNSGARLVSEYAVSHVMGCTPPRGSFIRLDDGIYISTPELGYLQMAGSASQAKLAEYAYELCGSYARDNKNGGFHNQPAVTTTEQLSRFLKNANGIKHVKKARRIVRYVANGSASPRETDTAIMACFPGNLGGYGFELPALNYELWVDDGTESGRKRKLVLDLCWPKHRVAIEYDSSAHHSGLGDIDRDSKRRALLELAGFRVITVTRKQMASTEEMHKVMKVLARHMGRELKIRAKDFYSKRLELRSELLCDKRAV